MITFSYEALIALVALCGGAGYMLGKDIHKAKKQLSSAKELQLLFKVNYLISEQPSCFTVALFELSLIHMYFNTVLH